MTSRTPAPFIPGKTKIPLQVPSYDADEVIEALDSLMSGWVTMGKKVKAFEEAWAAYIGVKHAVMTNSGSSANLLALSALDIPKGSEIITPALTWATTVFPIAQAGFVPVLVDVERETYNIDRYAVGKALTRKTRAFMPVHLLGNPVDLWRKDVYVIEDACEAHGAEINGRKVGSFGTMGTFSFFFSHHISTIEGGMITTNDDWIATRLRSLRAFGWTREHPNQESLGKAYPDIDPRFRFVFPGFNFRPTEIAGAFGLHQLPKLEGFIKVRRENAAWWNKEFERYQDWLQLPIEAPGTRHVSFAYALQVKEGAPFTKQALQDHLEALVVETRPIEAGNMAIQPAMRHIKWRQGGPLTNSEYIHHNAFMIGNHQGIGKQEREAVAEYVHEFMGGL